MRSLRVKYSGLFQGLEKKPDSYRVIADQYEWKKRDVKQHIEGYRYDEFNSRFLPDILQDATNKVIVECGCGLGANLIPFKKKNKCIGLDYSLTALNKLKDYTSEIKTLNADISSIPLQTESVDYVILARVIFVHEDLSFVARILDEVSRILKKGGKAIIVNDFCNTGIWFFTSLCDLGSKMRSLLPRMRSTTEFMLYYFSKRDMETLLEDAALKLNETWLCNVHQGVYHLTYHNKLLGLLLRNNRRHFKIRHKDHWERVRLSHGINEAYPLNLFGRLISFISSRLLPSVAALSFCCLAEKKGD